MPFLPLSDGGRIYYEVHGRGPLLMLVTGVNGVASFWPRAVVDALAKQYTVVVHDQRGSGQSSMSRIHYSLEQMCADVIAIQDTIGFKRSHMIGHSLGGAIAQTMALDRPGRVDRLVLSGTWPGPDAYFNTLLELRRDMLLHGSWDHYVRFASLLMQPAWWVRDHAGEVFGAVPPAPSQAEAAIMAARLNVVLGHDRRADLHRVRAPTLVIGARDDTWTPAYFSAELGKLIPNAETVILPEGQHFFPQVVPDTYAAILQEFLGRSTDLDGGRQAS